MAKKTKKKNTLDMSTQEIEKAVKETVGGKVAAALVLISFIPLIVGHGFWRWFWFVLILCFGVAGLQVTVEGMRKNKRDKAVNAIKGPSTKCVGDYLYVNEKKQTWCVSSAGLVEHPFADLLDFNVVQDGETISSANIADAIAGGFVFGFWGALVGASKTKTSKTCTKLQVKMNVNNIQNPVIYIDLIDHEVMRDSDEYKEAVSAMEEITGVLRVIKTRNES